MILKLESQIYRAKELIDFNPSINLETGLKKTIKYFSL